MPVTMTPSTQIMHILAHSNGCLLEELVLECENLTWNQVFLALDRLSRDGKVRLMRKGGGEYFIMPVHLEQAEGGGVTKAR